MPSGKLVVRCWRALACFGYSEIGIGPHKIAEEISGAQSHAVDSRINADWIR